MVNNHNCNHSNECGMCESHGFPCTTCADLVYNGELGPGHIKSKRTLIADYCKTSIVAMIQWIENNPLEDILWEGGFKRVYSLDENDVTSTCTTELWNTRSICIA